MSTTFEKGYALLIGVSDQMNPLQAPKLPATENDVTKLAQILVDPEKSGYKADNVKILVGKEATKMNIFNGLKWLKKNIGEDPNATAIVYFSGHGYRKEEEDKFYMAPYDFDLEELGMTAIEDQEFTKRINKINAQQLLLLLDCCHAGETSTLHSPNGFSSRAANPEIFIGGKPINEPKEQNSVEPTSKPIGPHRAVIVSSSGNEESYIHEDKEIGLSIFTYHLIEALNGHGLAEGKHKTVDAADLISWVSKNVPVTTMAQHQKDQTPNHDSSGAGGFPIALLMGGKGIPKEEKPLSVEKALGSSMTITIKGDGNITAEKIEIGGDQNIDNSENKKTGRDRSIVADTVNINQPVNFGDTTNN